MLIIILLIIYIVYIGTFVEQLKSNTTLRGLNLNRCSLTSLSVSSLAEALTTNKYLKVLDISNNSLCDVQHLAHALRVNQGLKILYLCRCSLTSMSAKSLAEALTTNKYLENLNINGNPLCDDGIQYLAQALQVNHYLKELDLGDCGITNIGLEYLVKSIQDNNGLNTLSFTKLAGYYDRSTWDLKESRIIQVLIECLPNNKTLTNLDLSCALGSYVTVIEEAVNDVRKQRGLPLLTVDVILDEAD